jgi:NAD(P)-dependent dehydrogenase (short-subunit alcohol dehydrogenase family)
MNVTRAVLPVMRRQRSGHIVSISSGAGISGFEFNSAYSAAKFGLEGWMESLQPEVEPFGINTTIVNPGFFRTDLLTPDSASYATPSIDDYADRHAERVQWYEDMNGHQEGDPAKLAQALLTITGPEQPPRRFLPWPASSSSPSRRPRPCRSRLTPSGTCPAPSPTTHPPITIPALTTPDLQQEAHR